MWSLLFLFACNIGSNNPPRFQTVNGEKVRYLLGIAFINPETMFIATPGETQTIDIEVTDSNNDEVELLFPAAPEGWEFDSSSRSGVWHVPEEPLNYFYNIQALAIDERGASDVVWFGYGIQGLWDTGAASDTGFAVETILGDVKYVLKGNGNVEHDFQGSLRLEAQSYFCSIIWEYPEPIGIETTSCADCEKTWKLRPRQGELIESDCDEILASYDLPVSIADLHLESILPEEISIGWSPAYVWNEITYENAVLREEESLWLPYGTGSLQNNRLAFSLILE